MSERYDCSAQGRHLVVYIGNSHLLSSRYEVASDHEIHEEKIFIQLTSDIMSKVSFVPGILK